MKLLFSFKIRYLQLKTRDWQARAAAQLGILKVDTEKNVAKNVKYPNFFLNYRDKSHSIFMSPLSQGRNFSASNYAFGFSRLG